MLYMLASTIVAPCRCACDKTLRATAVLTNIPIAPERRRNQVSTFKSIHSLMSKLALPVIASKPECPWKFDLVGRLPPNGALLATGHPREVPNHQQRPLYRSEVSLPIVQEKINVVNLYASRVVNPSEALLKLG